MRVKMRSLGAGPNGPRHPGVELDVSQAEGEQLVKGGYADALPDAVETAEEPQDHETAVTADPKKGGKGRRG